MNEIIPIMKLLDFHDQLVKTSIDSIEANNPINSIWKFIEINHRSNQMLWHQEDLARRNDVEPIEIMLNKRTIDKYNQQRNDAIEGIDHEFLLKVKNVELSQNAQLNSETVGSIIDRLSILSLKLDATLKQTQRNDVTAQHIETCNSRFLVLTTQRGDLASCLDNLICNFLLGLNYYKIYKQFKMYNDPKFNVHIK